MHPFSFFSHLREKFVFGPNSGTSRKFRAWLWSAIPDENELSGCPLKEPGLKRAWIQKIRRATLMGGLR